MSPLLKELTRMESLIAFIMNLKNFRSDIIPPTPALGPGSTPASDPFIIRESCIFAFAHSSTQQPTD